MSNDRYDELAALWFSRARDDLEWAKDSFVDGHFSGVCFLCQQIVEKSLKAYLFKKRQNLVRTHDTERLLELCLSFDTDFQHLKSACNIVNDYYVDTRYPDIWDIQRFQTKALAREALKEAKKTISFIQKKLPAQ